MIAEDTPIFFENYKLIDPRSSANSNHKKHEENYIKIPQNQIFQNQQQSKNLNSSQKTHIMYRKSKIRMFPQGNNAWMDKIVEQHLYKLLKNTLTMTQKFIPSKNIFQKGGQNKDFYGYTKTERLSLTDICYNKL